MKTINELVNFFEDIGCTKYEAYDLAFKEQQTKLLERINQNIERAFVLTPSDEITALEKIAIELNNIKLLIPEE